MHDDEVRAALLLHWAASDADDFEAEHQIYKNHAVLEYPNRTNVFAVGGASSRRAWRSRTRSASPCGRLLGGDGLWISELIITYDEHPVHVVSIMEFEGGEVVRETQYLGEPFAPGASRAQWSERMD